MTNLTVFGTKSKDSIYLPSVPFAVRNNCAAGQWAVGESDFRGNSIDISIIKASHQFGSLGKTLDAQWLQLFFIPAPGEDKLPSNTVCVTYLKSRSLDQFSQKITELMQNGEPALGIFTASFEKHQGDLGTYYSVQWDWRERKGEAEEKQLEAIAAFMEGSPALFDPRVAGVMDCIDGLSAEAVHQLMQSRKQERDEENAQPVGKLAGSKK